VSGFEVKEPLALQPVLTPLTGALSGRNTGIAAITQIKGGTRPYAYQIDNGNYTADTLYKNLSAGEHTLVVKDKNGCTSTVPFRIENAKEIEIPDGFTPNGDGLNDTWELANIQSLYPDCKVIVFNRWGNEVFQSTGYKKPWDGTNKGQKLPDGTYYGIIELSKSDTPIRKAITIMR
jgi:gliding motility-associated-like protein